MPHFPFLPTPLLWGEQLLFPCCWFIPMKRKKEPLLYKHCVFILALKESVKNKYSFLFLPHPPPDSFQNLRKCQGINNHDQSLIQDQNPLLPPQSHRCRKQFILCPQITEIVWDSLFAARVGYYLSNCWPCLKETLSLKLRGRVPLKL